MSELREPFTLGAMPPNAPMLTVDVHDVAAPIATIFSLARDVAAWPRHLAHYRSVEFIERSRDGGGVVTMRANRPFGAVNWPTWWTSEMQVSPDGATEPWIRFRHIRGITTGMEVLWSFTRRRELTHVAIVHMWNGPRWPVIGKLAARRVIGPVFVHGIASRTLAGLARVAEWTHREQA
ncbi:MAG TPA: SRPBCC family protein [Gemmatimonadaceae bacterium]|jgi:ribosome-associated toxin RatA of RatAB toxin-antitoxin module|nr:SRPBCC family protein [Gemmatimonadaceae bacterium]